MLTYQLTLCRRLATGYYEFGILDTLHHVVYVPGGEDFFFASGESALDYVLRNGWRLAELDWSMIEDEEWAQANVTRREQCEQQEEEHQGAGDADACLV